MFRFVIPLFLVAICMQGCTGPSISDNPAGSRPDSSTSTQNISFTDVTNRSGLEAFLHQTGAAASKKWMPEAMGSGGGFIDYNGDGWIDILLVGGGSWAKPDQTPVQALWLYKNNGDGSFTLASEAAGLENINAYGFGISVADYDNDDDQDFFFTTLRQNKLFRNDEGSFTEVGQAAGLSNRSEWSSSAIFFDANKDGWLDLYVGNYVEWSPENDVFCSFDGKTKSYCTPDVYDGVASRFYLSNGDGTFTDKTKEAGFLPAPGKTLGVAELDFDSNGWPDLVVANDLQRNLLYQNNGNGTFTETGVTSGIAFDPNGVARAGMGIDAGKVDSSQNVSVFVGNFSKEMLGVYRHARGTGLFIDRAAVSKIGRPTLSTLTFGLFLFDVEFDADLDLLITNGHVQEHVDKVQNAISYRQPPQLFLNADDGTFAELKAADSVLNQPLVARGAAYADIDRDGDLDVLITENKGPAHLWRNDSTTGRFLRVHLQGTQSNQDGIGAKVTVLTNGQRQERRVHTGSSYLSQSEKTVTFGLGTARQVDSLIIKWPSGQTDHYKAVEANQEVLVVEGSSVKPQPLAKRQ